MTEDADAERHVGVFGATLVGIGGIIGGGLLILVGTAFAHDESRSSATQP